MVEEYAAAFGFPEFEEPLDDSVHEVVEAEVEVEDTKEAAREPLGESVAFVLPLEQDVGWDTYTLSKLYANALERQGYNMWRMTAADDPDWMMWAFGAADHVVSTGLARLRGGIMRAALSRLSSTIWLHVRPDGIGGDSGRKASNFADAAKANLFPSRLAFRTELAAMGVAGLERAEVVYPPLGGVKAEKGSRMGRFWIGSVLDGTLPREDLELYIQEIPGIEYKQIGDENVQVGSWGLDEIATMTKRGTLVVEVPPGQVLRFGVAVGIALVVGGKVSTSGDIGALELEKDARKTVGLAEQRFLEIVGG